MIVYKYHVPIADEFTLDLPVGAKPLCVQLQNGTPTMWVALPAPPPIDPSTMFNKHVFKCCGTGHDRDDINVVGYISTIQISGFVFHYFQGER